MITYPQRLWITQINSLLTKDYGVYMKNWIIGFRDMFAEWSIMRLLASCMMLVVATALLVMDLAYFINFNTIANKVMTITIIAVIISQIVGLLGFGISLIARLIMR